MQGSDAFTWDLLGRFSARDREGGMTLSVVFTKGVMRVSQGQADAMSLNQEGEFEIALL